jgi:hypothetical protein
MAAKWTDEFSGFLLSPQSASLSRVCPPDDDTPVRNHRGDFGNSRYSVSNKECPEARVDELIFEYAPDLFQDE